jgi:large subunit ribosomal protein L6
MENNIRTSRIGRLPITIPNGVKIEQKDKQLTVNGKLGTLTMDVHRDVEVVIEDNVLNVNINKNDKKVRSLHGLTRALINNMVVGVSEGFTKNLQMVGVGYRASVQGTNLKLEVGKSHDVLMEIPKGITAEVSKKQTDITLKSIDKALLGQFAADVIKQRPPEPYKGKGIRFAGQIIKLKAGKKAGK